MSIELFNTLLATVSGSVVTLTWTNVFPGFPPVTTYSVQRKQFGYGDETFVTIASGITPATSMSQTDSPGVGDWSYRVVAVMAQGGTNGGLTNIDSNQVNVTTEAVTGAVTLTLTAKPSVDQPTYTRVTFNWSIAGTGVDVRRYELQQTIDAGAHWKTIHTQDEFSNLFTHVELPPGLGAIFFRVIADLPSATPPYQADVQSISNTVTITT